MFGRRKAFFEYRHDSTAHVRGSLATYGPHLHRLTNPARGSRLQTSSRPVGVAQNWASPQRFGTVHGPNALERVQAAERTGSRMARWKAYGRAGLGGES